MAIPSLLALTPPMGWNSYISFACGVNEEQIRAQARVVADKLAGFGYRYVVIDGGWYSDTDELGRYVPDVKRFASAAGGAGFKPLADYIHSLGLRFGIHIMRGIPRSVVERNMPILGSSQRAADVADTSSICNWSPQMWGLDMSQGGAQAYLDSNFQLYAQWEVDFIKADDMVDIPRPAGELYHAAETQGLALAIAVSGRPMVLSLSPGDFAQASMAAHMRSYAQMARISPDFWDNWPELSRLFDLAPAWAPHIGQGFWPDLDMLPLGRIGMGFDSASRGPERDTRFTHDEQRSLMTLAAIFRSPLMMGGDLTKLDSFTLELLTNPEVLEVNQHSGSNCSLPGQGRQAAWTAMAPQGEDRFLALFNLGDTSSDVQVELAQLGLRKQVRVRDLWKRSDLGTAANRWSVSLPSHGAGLYRLIPC